MTRQAVYKLIEDVMDARVKKAEADRHFEEVFAKLQHEMHVQYPLKPVASTDPSAFQRLVVAAQDVVQYRTHEHLDMNIPYRQLADALDMLKQPKETR
jgi:hypothetical protein